MSATVRSRRWMLGALTASALANVPRLARAEEVIDLAWEDLIPDEGGGVLMQKLRETVQGIGVVEHGELTTGFDQAEAHAVTDAYNGLTVRLPGFIIPLDFDGTGVTAFILAPFVGACIHVPPPPANQLVFVTTSEPYESAGLYEPVYVTGMFGIAATGTQLAEIGYALSADKIEPYE